jgi:hypothetical protein
MPRTKKAKAPAVTPEPFTIADKYSMCFCHYGIIDEGQPVYQRDNRPVCKQCAPLYDLKRPPHEGGTTSKARRPRK